MNNPVYASTGTVIGRSNGFNYRLIPVYCPQMHADAYELMMLTAWFDDLDTVAQYLKKSGLKFPVTHAEKNVGEYLGNGDDEEALRRFKLCVKTAQTVGSEKMVLHLWSGLVSDRNFDHNLTFCEKFRQIAADAGVLLCIENIPCSVLDPLSHWKQIHESCPEQKFIFDTRMGAFHNQLYTEAREWFREPLIGSVAHMHVSDFVGPSGDFSKLRPIPQPGEGIIDFEQFFGYALPSYHGSITLESPVLHEDGTVDIEKLNKTLDYINKAVGK